MMKFRLALYVCLFITFSSCRENIKDKEWASIGFECAEQQLSAQLKAVPDPTTYPRTIRKDGEL